LAREPSAFERQVLPHLDAAYNLARWLVRDPATADDVVQEAMLRALRYHAGLRGEAKPWLLQIVRNVAYATIGKNVAGATITRRDPPGAEDADDPVDPADDPEAALARNQGMRQLDLSLAALPAELRECLVLRELEELSYKEIAQVTGVAIGTVMSRLWRARQALLGTAMRGPGQ
jgi:RNA polymerase sigma-70 factor (ECF subfamily)